MLDHGLLYGDGVFEGIRITQGRIFRLNDHIARLARSAQAIGLALPYSRTEIAAIVTTTARAHGAPEAYVRLLVTRGAGALGIDPLTCEQPDLICIVATLDMFPAEKRLHGIDVMVSARRRPSVDALDPQVKSLNYLNNVLAKREARLSGFDDAILLNHTGHVAEASGANLFAVVGDCLVTPPTSDGALPGMTRDALLALAPAIGIAVGERSLTLYDLLDASEVFLSGSGAGLVCVSRIDHHPTASERPLAARLSAAFAEYATTHGTPFLDAA